MATGRNKKKQLVDNLIRDEIVKTVLHLIKEEKPVTMEEIARHCGVAKGTLYNYFKDKKALFNYVHNIILEPIREKNNIIFKRTGDPRVTLHKFIDSVFEIEEDVALYFRFVQQKKTVASQNDERFDLLTRLLIGFCRRGIQDGFFIKVDPLILAEMLYGTIIGPLIALPLLGDVSTDRDKLKQDIYLVVDRIILKKQEKI